ncbi:hypothetical protein TIFTF001_005705 [Ficus carica]|uniref:Uncharacterized protein n=1 Tax=Ficus carica TaxID=3494 RepID=A0AA87ZL94_FICCA|nr:hypothetical protein TIFTF001_005705 [Ficus carica]
MANGSGRGRGRKGRRDLDLAPGSRGGGHWEIVVGREGPDLVGDRHPRVGWGDHIWHLGRVGGSSSGEKGPGSMAKQRGGGGHQCELGDDEGRHQINGGLGLSSALSLSLLILLI